MSDARCEHCGTELAYAPQGEYCPNDQCPPYLEALRKHPKRSGLFTEAEIIKIENNARALAIREATDFVWENLQEDSGAEDLTYERDLCDRLLALLSATHADAQAAHDKRVRLEIFEYLEPYIDPPTPSHTGPCNSESGCDGNCMNAAHFAEFVAELRAEPPSKSGEGR